MDEILNEKVLNSPVCSKPIKTTNDVKAFFRFIWFGLHLDFTPDDDFQAFGLFSDKAAALLNARMDEAFALQKDKVYDLVIQVMQEADPT
ncbi:MAG: hypothetical protein IJP70_01460 [Bacteroidales bacterium]|nr:hypothetical protein [Bacteroidales bacterium]